MKTNLQFSKDSKTNHGQISYYKADILELFQNRIIENLGHKKFESYEFLRDKTMDEIGIHNYQDPDLAFLNSWYSTHINHNFLYKFIEDEKIREIIIHGPSLAQCEINSKFKGFPINIDKDFFQLSLEIFAQKNNVEWNYSAPFASFYTKIKDVSFRATLIHFSTSPSETSKLFLRRISDSPFPLTAFGDKECAEFIKELITTKQNIVVAGQTGSGKSALLTTMLTEIDEDEHVVVLEDTHEIAQVSRTQTSMLAKNLNGKTLVDYCSYTLRMRPDRIILGEMRSVEVVPFILAMNNGHKGLLSTIHANSAVDTISRLSLLFSLYSTDTSISYKLITKLICANIDYVIFMKDRKIAEIIKILGSENETPFIEQILQ